MKNILQELVNEITTNWREQQLVLERGGLLGIPKSKQGKLSEDYICRRIERLKPEYVTARPKGSRTPADIYAVARRNGYWHIMLIQVKSSIKEDRIHELTKDEINAMNKLAKFVFKTISKSDLTEEYKDKPIVITTGYAGVLQSETNGGIRNSLIKAKSFYLFSDNATQTVVDSAKKTLGLTHRL